MLERQASSVQLASQNRNFDSCARKWQNVRSKTFYKKTFLSSFREFALNI